MDVKAAEKFGRRVVLTPVERSRRVRLSFDGARRAQFNNAIHIRDEAKSLTVPEFERLVQICSSMGISVQGPRST